MSSKSTIKGFRVTGTECARKKRGKSQRIFLILTHESDKDYERKYEVMGTTGNAYTVTVNARPSCTCPDHTTRNRRCKHIFFVLTRIMKVREDQEDIEKYTEDDLEEMFENIPNITENLKVNVTQLNRYRTLQKNKNGEVDRKEIDDDEMCPICLGDMLDCDEELSYCRYYCGTNIHKECFDMYNSKQYSIKCLFCHNNWIEEKKNYINLE